MNNPATPPESVTVRHLARMAFTSILLTFIASRVLVILIMTRKMPDLFFHAGSTHVHHLNYGISLLSLIGAVLLFSEHLTDAHRIACAWLYGFAMALTFDEFGMWLHLGGGYWQRASFDGIVVVLSFFGMIAFWPPVQKMKSHHWLTGGICVVAMTAFYIVLFQSLNYAGKKVGPALEEIEHAGPQ